MRLLMLFVHDSLPSTLTTSTTRGSRRGSHLLRANDGTLSVLRLTVIGNDGRVIDEARVLLADIYNWFTEGCDTADLKDAKVLLDELNS